LIRSVGTRIIRLIMKKHLRPISRLKRKRAHGFLRRMSTRGGQKTLNRRRQKGRWQLIPA